MKRRQQFLIILALVCFSTPALAAVDWSVNATLETKTAIKDVATSFDGKNVFVLTEADELVMYDEAGVQQGSMQVAPAMDKLVISGFQKAGVPEQITLVNSATGQIQKISFSLVARIDTTGSPFLGSAEAPVEVVIFSDFQCPYCAQAGTLLEEILEQNPESVKIIFKHFPLNFHEQAQPAAQAAIAAHQQGKFWQYHDLLYANHKSLTAASYEAFAQELGLDMTAFNRDRRSRTVQQQLVKDINIGKQIGVTGTPAVFVNGHRVKKRTPEVIQAMIDAELKK